MIKKFFTLLLICLCFLNISSLNAQIGDFDAALSGDSESSNGNEVEDWFFLVDLLWYPTYGLLFGFEGEHYPDEIKYSKYPYEWVDEGIYRPYRVEGFDRRSEFNLHFQSNEDRLYGGYGQLKFSPWSFLNIELNHLQLFEADPEEEQNNRLSITNFNVQYNRIRHQRIQAWWGLGLTHINSEEKYTSPSVVFGTTIFIKKPISLYMDTQLAYPNGVFASQTQIRLQVHLKQFKVYAGYQGLRFGSTYEPNWTFGAGTYF